MLNLVLFGPPGSGKGTQSELLISKKKLIHLSTGDLLRSEISNKTTLGLQAKQLMDQGVLVPDEVVIGMIKNKIEENIHSNGFIFDGFPRTVPQAEALDKVLEEKGLSINKVLSLDVPKKMLAERLLNRGKTSGRTDDTSEEKIEQRLEEYENKTLPVLSYYKQQNKCATIDGVGEINEIFQRLTTHIGDV